MLLSPCKEVKAGDTVRKLAVAHVSNYDCVQLFEIKMNDLRKWKAEKLNSIEK